MAKQIDITKAELRKMRASLVDEAKNPTRVDSLPTLVRESFDEIEAALKAGMEVEDVVAFFRERGIELELTAFKRQLGIERRGHGRGDETA